MNRLRRTAWVALAALGLLSGCTSCGNTGCREGLFSRLTSRRTRNVPCCEAAEPCCGPSAGPEGGPGGEGPILFEGGPNGGMPVLPPPNVVQPTAPPPLAPPPLATPPGTPPAQPVPAEPSSRKK